VLTDEVYDETYGAKVEIPDAIPEAPQAQPKPGSIRGWQVRVLQLNAQRLKEAGTGAKVGLIKTEAELERFEATGEWPEYLPVAQWHEVDARYGKRPGAAGTVFQWVRKLVTARQYEALYAGRPGYWVLETAGSDVVVGFKKPLPGGWKQGQALEAGMAWCNAEEVAKLEAASGRN
jgi:hypothetical protein